MQRGTQVENAYAVVDARTGLLEVEVFTRPHAAWWRRITLMKNACLMRVMSFPANRYGWQGMPAAFPARSLAQVWHLTPSDQPAASDNGPLRSEKSGVAGSADQVIARYFVFTDYGSSERTDTPHGPHFRLTTDRQPGWFISEEGVDQPYAGSIPVSDPKIADKMLERRNEEMNYVINALTGASDGSPQYR